MASFHFVFSEALVSFSFHDSKNTFCTRGVSRNANLHFQITFSLPSTSCLLKLPSDRPAQTPRVVLAVASHNSIKVFDLTSASLRDLTLLYDIIGGFKQIVFSKGSIVPSISVLDC